MISHRIDVCACGNVIAQQCAGPCNGTRRVVTQTCEKCQPTAKVAEERGAALERARVVGFLRMCATLGDAPVGRLTRAHISAALREAADAIERGWT